MVRAVGFDSSTRSMSFLVVCVTAQFPKTVQKVRDQDDRDLCGNWTRYVSADLLYFQRLEQYLILVPKTPDRFSHLIVTQIDYSANNLPAKNVL